MKIDTKLATISKTKKKKKKTALKSQDFPLLTDKFERDKARMEERHLVELHRATLWAQNRKHQMKLQAILTQLQSQLLKVWNDAWLQRVKSADKSFQDWLKVLGS